MLHQRNKYKNGQSSQAKAHQDCLNHWNSSVKPVAPDMPKYTLSSVSTSQCSSNPCVLGTVLIEPITGHHQLQTYEPIPTAPANERRKIAPGSIPAGALGTWWTFVLWFLCRGPICQSSRTQQSVKVFFCARINGFASCVSEAHPAQRPLSCIWRLCCTLSGLVDVTPQEACDKDLLTNPSTDSLSKTTNNTAP